MIYERDLIIVGEIELPSLTLAKQQVSDWEMTSSTSDSVGTAIAYWHDKKAQKSMR